MISDFTVLFNIFSLIISVVTFFIVVQLRGIIIDKVLNNIDLEMSKIAFQELSELGNTAPEKGIRAYIRKSLNDVFNKYLRVKSKGLSIINDPSFVADLIGNAEPELNSYYDGYPKDFLNAVDKIAIEQFQKFKENLLFDLKTSKKSNYRDALKVNVLIIFKSFTQAVVDEFNKYKYQIDDPELKKNLNGHFYLNEKTKFLDFETKITVKKDELKELIGRGSIGRAIDILMSLSNPLNENEIIALKSRFSKYKSDSIFGMESSENLNKLKYDLLEYIANI